MDNKVMENKERSSFKYNSILIVTYGRSGSTLLQGILNSINGCLIKGENSNFCYQLYKGYCSIIESNKHPGKNTYNPWFGGTGYNSEKYISVCKSMLSNFLLGEDITDKDGICYGFKEVRYTIDDITSDFEGYLNFLTHIFPNVAFIFNIRNHEQVARSAWWAKMNKSEVKRILSESEQRFFNYHQKHTNSYIISYEDIILKSERLQEMYRFLGAEYDEKIIDHLLAIPHSYKT